jgi:hypothetical protein
LWFHSPPLLCFIYVKCSFELAVSRRHK